MMGTRRKIALWWQRSYSEFVVVLPEWKHGVEMVFRNQRDMLSFARGAGRMLKQIERG